MYRESCILRTVMRNKVVLTINRKKSNIKSVRLACYTPPWFGLWQTMFGILIPMVVLVLVGVLVVVACLKQVGVLDRKYFERKMKRQRREIQITVLGTHGGGGGCLNFLCCLAFSCCLIFRNIVVFYLVVFL